MKNIVKLSPTDAEDFNKSIHQAVLYGMDMKERKARMFKIWKWFVSKHTTIKENEDTSIGYEGFGFGVQCSAKAFIVKDLVNNLIACHESFKTTDEDVKFF